MNLGTYDINIDFSKLFIHNNTSIYFKEGDLNTAKVRARLTMKNKPINVAGCNVTIRVEPSEGNTITDNATVIDPLNGIIEIDFKSNALLEGTHLFEVWIIKDESIKKSGKIGYRVLDSIEDAGSIEGTNEYPILISLISDANKAIQDAKEALNIANTMQIDITEATDNAYRSANDADIATSNANTKIEEVETAKTEMIKKVDTSIETMKSDVEVAKNEMASK
ncbi:MAG: BppU family phage baseplate upper protein, partial [Paraclostridium sp.]